MSGVQSIERAFAVLRALVQGPTGVTDLADRIDLPKSTVSRILSALEAENVVEQIEAGGEYRLSEGLAELASNTTPGRNLVATARPYLDELADLTGETSGISVLEGDSVFYLEQVETEQDVQVRDWTGESTPWHSVPSGLVMIAHSPATLVEACLRSELVRSTAKSIVDPSIIRQRLAKIREEGFAWVFAEFHPELNSVAAPVLDPDGEVVAAIHVHGPSFRFPDMSDRDRFGRLVADAATKLADQLTG